MSVAIRMVTDVEIEAVRRVAQRIVEVRVFGLLSAEGATLLHRRFVADDSSTNIALDLTPTHKDCDDGLAIHDSL